MTDENEQNQGLQEAHPQAENFVDAERAAKVGATRAMTEAAMNGLAEQLAGAEPDAEQQSLMFDHDEAATLFRGPVKHVANIRDAAKRARGRPAGSQNRRSTDLANYLLNMGYRDPALNLADLANADPLALALELAGVEAMEGVSAQEQLALMVTAGQMNRSAVVALIDSAQGLLLKANAELMPYFHAKRPQEVNVNKNLRGFMVFGEMPEAEQRDKTLTMRAVGATEKDQ